MAVPSAPLKWLDDKAPHSVNLAAGITEARSILLKPNQWSLASLNVEPPVPSIDVVLQSIAGKYCRVLGETQVYDCLVPLEFRSLKEIHGAKGYYIRLDDTASSYLLVEGVPTDPATPIPLHAGLNWVGYLPGAAQPVASALASIAGKYLLVTDGALTYDPALPQYSTLKRMEPGKGYLIYATGDATLVYPASAAASPEAPPDGGTLPDAPAGQCAGVSQTPWFTVFYGDLLLDEAPAAADTRVEVVTPRGDVAGCFTVDNTGQYGFLTVYGEDASASPAIPGFRDGEPITVRVNGTPVTLPDIPAWSDDKTPHRLDLSAKDGGVKSYLPVIMR